MSNPGDLQAGDEVAVFSYGWPTRFARMKVVRTSAKLAHLEDGTRIFLRTGLEFGGGAHSLQAEKWSDAQHRNRLTEHLTTAARYNIRQEIVAASKRLSLAQIEAIRAVLRESQEGA